MVLSQAFISFCFNSPWILWRKTAITFNYKEVLGWCLHKFCVLMILLLLLKIKSEMPLFNWSKTKVSKVAMLEQPKPIILNTFINMIVFCFYFISLKTNKRTLTFPIKIKISGTELTKKHLHGHSNSNLQTSQIQFYAEDITSSLRVFL